MKKVTFLLLCCCLLSVGQLFAQTTVTKKFTVDSTRTFIVPEGVYEITVEAWGAGGAGGYASSELCLTSSPGGGGGAYAKSLVSVTPGQTFDIIVGVGGTNTGSVMNDGGFSAVRLGTDDVVRAAGGKTANSRSATKKTWYSLSCNFNGAKSGAAGGSIGDCVANLSARMGQSGGNCDDGTNGGGCSSGKGGDAGGIGDGVAGSGGSGHHSEVHNGLYGSGSDGNNYGGGGSGAIASGLGGENGGKGANGFVRITYTQIECDATAGAIEAQGWTCTPNDTTISIVSTTDASAGYNATLCTYSWQVSENGTDWSDIEGANTKYLTPSETGSYRRGYIVPGCTPVYTEPVSVVRPNAINAGYVANAIAVLDIEGGDSDVVGFCKGTTDVGVMLNATDVTGALSIDWQTSLDGETWTSTGTTGKTYNYSPTTIENTVYIRYECTMGEGCVFPSNNIFTVEAWDNPVINAFEQPQSLCPSLNEYLVSAVVIPGDANITTYSWSYNGNTVTNQILEIAETNLNNCNTTYQYALTVTDENGCTAQGSGQFTTNNPLVEITNFPDSVFADTSSVCAFEVPDLTEMFLHYVTECSGSVNTVTASPAIGEIITTSTDVTYTVMNRCGSSATQTVKVVIPEAPKVKLTADQESICFGGQATLEVIDTTSSMGKTYTWTPADRVVDLDVPVANKKLTVAETGLSPLAITERTYTVTVKDEFGCEGSDTINIYTNPKADSIADVNATICSGLSYTYNIPENIVPVSPSVTTYTWEVKSNEGVTGLGVANQAVPQTNFNVDVLENATLASKTIVYTVTPTTTTESVACAGETFEVSITVKPVITNEGAITNFDNETVTITLWYSACDTLYYVEKPTYSNNIAEYVEDVDIIMTNNVSDEYNEGTEIFYYMTPGEYSITWTLTDPCGAKLDFVQKFIVRFPNCGENDANYTEPYRVTDVDGNTYTTVRVGCDCWTAENLKTKPGKAYHSDLFPDSLANVENFGRLYSWYEAVAVVEGDNNAVPTKFVDVVTGPCVQGICPAGWALPVTDNYMTLLEYANTSIAAVKSAEQNSWLPGRTGTNALGFNAKGAGYYDNSIGRYLNLLGQTYFWTSETGLTNMQAKNVLITHSCGELLYGDDDLKGMGCSVRCIKKEGQVNP